jgi:KDO2-lipid IV(A) lauroyltransferase
VLDPADKGLIRIISAAAARTQHRIAEHKRAAVRNELQRTFTHHPWTERSLDRATRSAFDLAVQCLVEELLLDQLDATTVGSFIDAPDRHHLDAALAHGRGAVLVYPHAGAVMLMIAWLATAGYDYVQVAARGFPPAERQVRPDVRPTWFNRAARAAREAAEDTLPCEFVTMTDPTRRLVRALERNAIVGLAFDGRGGTRFDRVAFLGRQANLASGPWRLAAMTGAAVVPAMCVRTSDRTHRIQLAPPLLPNHDLPRAEQAAELRERALSPISAWLRAHPDHYARWIAHCAEHAAMDDHPLFD